MKFDKLINRIESIRGVNEKFLSSLLYIYLAVLKGIFFKQEKYRSCVILQALLSCRATRTLYRSIANSFNRILADYIINIYREPKTKLKITDNFIFLKFFSNNLNCFLDLS